MSGKDGPPPAKKKRGLSVDDKRKVILDIYHQKAEPMNLKEVETFGSKAVSFNFYVSTCII